FSRSPWDSHPAYLCRFAVRAPVTSLEVFLGSVNSGTSLLFSLPITAYDCWTDLPIQLAYCLGARFHRCAFPILLRPPHCSNGQEVVQEYLPVIHRLRLSASA